MIHTFFKPGTVSEKSIHMAYFDSHLCVCFFLDQSSWTVGQLKKTGSHVVVGFAVQIECSSSFFCSFWRDCGSKRQIIYISSLTDIWGKTFHLQVHASVFGLTVHPWIAN